MPVLLELLELVESFEPLVDDVDDELVELLSSELDDVFDVLPVEDVPELCAAEWATPAMRVAVSATPATAAEPPASIARRKMGDLLPVVFMSTTIGLGASAAPHRNVKAVLSLPGGE
jgi:hypothetical protein